MHYALWGDNLIADFRHEADALATVLELLAVGWSAEELAIIPERDDGDLEDLVLPPVLAGAGLAERARATEPSTPTSVHV